MKKKRHLEQQGKTPSFSKLICLIGLLALSLSPTTSKAQDSLVWYLGTERQVWYFQPDVYAFRCVGGANFSGLPDDGTVDEVVWHEHRNDQAVELLFNEGSSPEERASVIAYVKANDQFEQEYPVVSMTPEHDYSYEEWYVIDDQLLVSFIDPNLSSQDVADLADRNHLDLVYEPAATFPGRRLLTHVFKLEPSYYDIGTVFEVLGDVVTNEIGIVAMVSPNFSNVRIPQYDEATTSYLDFNGSTLACATNDPAYPNDWHIENDGSFWGGNSLNGASAHICECWNLPQAPTGDGIKVAIIGHTVWDYYHEDMDADFKLGWDCNTGTCVQLNPATCGQTFTDASGFHMAGIIGATNGNSKGAVGIAPDTEIMPFLVGEESNTFSFAAIHAAFQKAIRAGVNEFDADIIVFGLWDKTIDPNFWTDVAYAQLYGRVRGGTARGTVLIASAGDNINSPSVTVPSYPAGIANVIGVVATNPVDELKTDNDGFDLGFQWSTKYGSAWLDVAAPGAVILNADITGEDGFNHTGAVSQPTNLDYYVLDEGAYSAAAVTAGTVALMMEMEPLHNFLDYEWALEVSADDVGPYTYNSGVSFELANGRINCGAAYLALSKTDQVSMGDISVVNPVHDRISVAWQHCPPDIYDVSIVDLLGRKVVLGQFETTAGQASFDCGAYSAGVYVLSVVGRDGGQSFSQKIVIF